MGEGAITHSPALPLSVSRPHVKIGVLTHNYPRYDGDFSGRFVAALSEELARQGHEVTVLAPWDAAFARHALRSSRGAGALPLRPARTGTGSATCVPCRPTSACATSRISLRRACWRVCGQSQPGQPRARPMCCTRTGRCPTASSAQLAARRHGIPLVVSIPGSDATVAAGNPIFGRMARFAFDDRGPDYRQFCRAARRGDPRSRR